MIKGWSTRRVVRQVERIIVSLGYDRFDDLDITGYTMRGASSYITFKPLGLTIRVSDHAQPFDGKWGGYDVTRGERHAKADFSISPTEKTVGELKWWLLVEVNFDNLPYLHAESDAMEFGRS